MCREPKRRHYNSIYVLLSLISLDFFLRCYVLFSYFLFNLCRTLTIKRFQKNLSALSSLSSVKSYVTITIHTATLYVESVSLAVGCVIVLEHSFHKMVNIATYKLF